MRRPTIHDVAARAEVSKSTVSLVLKGSPLVKADKRDAVRRAMAELGYVYNAAAAGLRGGKTALSPAQNPPLVALTTDLTAPEQAEFAAALQHAAAAKGMGLLLLAQGQPYQGRRITTFLGDMGGDTVLTALHPRAQVRPLDGQAAARATRHLLGMGAHAIAFVGGDLADPAASLRIRGYVQRMAKAELPPLHLAGGLDFAFGARAAQHLHQDHPTCTAALCITDQVALGMAWALTEAGRKLGTDFRLVGWGDSAGAQAADLSSIAPAWPALADYCLRWAETCDGAGCEVEPSLIRRASSVGA